jgi:hypothetical protein
MKFFLTLLAAVAAHAAITGTVINKTTGKPAVNATVGFNRLEAQAGITLVDQAHTDANGAFTINQTPQGPCLLRTAFDGVTYNHMLPPGSPTTGITVEVYNSSKSQGKAKVSKHMILFEPGGSQMQVNETYLYSNDGNTAWNDPDNGTLRFVLPPSAGGKVQVNVTAPGGMPIPAAAQKSQRGDAYMVDFAVKPGETRFDLTYLVSYTEGSEYAGKILTKDDNTYLIAPNGVTMTGEGLNDMGQEPRTQAHIFGFNGTSYKVKFSGAAAAAPADSAGGDTQESSGPQIEQIMPRLYGKAPVILGLALGILALGFVILYRSAPGAPAASPAAAPHKGALSSTGAESKRPSRGGVRQGE